MYAHFVSGKWRGVPNLQDMKGMTYSCIKKVSQVFGAGKGMCGIVVGGTF